MADLSVEGLGGLSVVAVDLVQEEGAPPVAQIQVQGDVAGLTAATGAVVRLRHGSTLVMSGRLDRLPLIASDDQPMWLRVVGGPADLPAAVEAAVAPLALAPWVSPLALADRATPSAAEILQAAPVSVEVDAPTGLLRVVPLVAGVAVPGVEAAPVLSLGEADVRAGSLTLRHLAAPPAAVRLTLRTRWTQRARRYCAVGRRLFGAFGIECLDPAGLVRQLPARGRRAGGWTVLEDRVDITGVRTQRVATGSTSAPNDHERTDIQIYKMRPRRAVILDLHRQLVRSGLTPILAGDYAQPREETVSLSLTPALGPGMAPGPVVDLGTVVLRDPVFAAPITDPDRLWQIGERFTYGGQAFEVTQAVVPGWVGLEALRNGSGRWARPVRAYDDDHIPGDSPRFFDTVQGIRALDHGVARLRRRLLLAARAVEITVTVPGERLVQVGPGNTVSLTAPVLPGGGASGKVVRVRRRIEARAATHWLEITLACCVGDGAPASTLAAGALAALPGASGFLDSGRAALEGGITVDLSQAAAPQQPVDLSRLSEPGYAAPIAVVDTGAGAAIRDLSALSTHTGGAVSQILETHAPQVVLQMRDLIGEQALERDVLAVLSPCPLPREVSP